MAKKEIGEQQPSRAFPLRSSLAQSAWELLGLAARAPAGFSAYPDEEQQCEKRHDGQARRIVQPVGGDLLEWRQQNKK